MCPFFPPKAARQRQAARPPSSSEGGIFVPLPHQDEFSTRPKGLFLVGHFAPAPSNRRMLCRTDWNASRYGSVRDSLEMAGRLANQGAEVAAGKSLQRQGNSCS